MTGGQETVEEGSRGRLRERDHLGRLVMLGKVERDKMRLPFL